MNAPAAFATSLAEGMATIVNCRASGRWGTFEALDDGRLRVIADGVKVIIASDSAGWVVTPIRSGGKSFPMCAADADLETAIGMALKF